jgi:S1-C subfamily serine protease
MKIAIVLPIALACIGCVRTQKAVTPTVSKPPDFAEAIDSIKLSVAPVVCAVADPNGSGWTVGSISGTAVFISIDGSFITPNHVIESMVNNPCQRPAVFGAVGGWRAQSKIDARIISFAIDECFRDKLYDLAACKIQAGPDKLKTEGVTFSPGSFSSVRPRDGEQVAFTGFPLQFKEPLTARGYIAAYAEIRPDDVPKTLIIDRTAWPGASGSPVYLRDGTIIGIVVSTGTGEASGITMARTGTVIQEFLARANAR